MFVFFAILAVNTYTPIGIASKPLHIIQGLVDTILTSWLGNNATAMVLATLAVGIPILTYAQKYEPKAELYLNSTKAALKGGIYKPSQAELIKQPANPCSATPTDKCRASGKQH